MKKGWIAYAILMVIATFLIINYLLPWIKAQDKDGRYQAISQLILGGFVGLVTGLLVGLRKNRQHPVLPMGILCAIAAFILRVFLFSLSFAYIASGLIFLCYLVDKTSEAHRLSKA